MQEGGKEEKKRSNSGLTPNVERTILPSLVPNSRLPDVARDMYFQCRPTAGLWWLAPIWTPAISTESTGNAWRA